jgi:hypothetical protein
MIRHHRQRQTEQRIQNTYVAAWPIKPAPQTVAAILHNGLSFLTHQLLKKVRGHTINGYNL